MGKQSEKFGEVLRSKLSNIETGLREVKSAIDVKANKAEQDVRAHLDAAKKRLEQDRAKVTAAQSEVKNWADEQKATTSEKIAEWKTKHETAKLQRRGGRRRALCRCYDRPCGGGAGRSRARAAPSLGRADRRKRRCPCQMTIAAPNARLLCNRSAVSRTEIGARAATQNAAAQRAERLVHILINSCK